MTDVNLHMNQIQDLSLTSLTNNFKDESGNLHGGKIEFGGKTYNVSILKAEICTSSELCSQGACGG